MPKLINLIKSKCKKYLPDSIYFFIYKVFIHTRYIISNKGPLDFEKLQLAKFTKSEVATVTVDDISFKIKLDPNNGLVDKEIYSKGSWEPEMLREIRSHLKENSVCLDVGSNIGQHTLYMSRAARAGKVYAFEPIPSLSDQIKESKELNNIKNIEVCNFGLSNTNESKEIYLNNLNMGNTTFKKRLGASSTLMVETRVFDDFWAMRGQIDFIKIDVEGYEYYALQGMEKSVRLYRPTMIIEFSPIFYNNMNISSREFLEYIFGLGYRVYDLDNNKLEITQDTSTAFISNTPSQTNILCLPTN